MMIIGCALLLVIAALFFTLFVRPQDIPDPIPVSPIQHLEDRKHAIYENLRDLQFEYRVGKLSDADYQQTKQALQKELAVVLAETEETLKNLGLTATRTHAKAAAPAPKEKREKKKASNVCPHCGAKFAEELKFCGECGKAMA